MSKPGHWTQQIERWPPALALWVMFTGIACFANLGGYGLLSMEGLIVDGARTMLAEGQWAVPIVYGDIYTYKPALAYWMSAAGQALAPGDSEWALRVPFALSGALLSLATLLLLGKRFGPRVGLFASMATVGATLFLEKSRLSEFDTPLFAGVGIAIVAASLSLAAERQRLWLWLLAYTGLTMGFLAKGSPALMIFFPGLVLAAAFNRRLGALVCWRHVLGALLFVTAITAYLWWALRVAGWEIFNQPVLEARVRGAEWSFDALALTAAKPLMTLAGFLPWSLALTLSWRSGRPWQGPDERAALSRAAIGFLAGGVVAFMAVPTHEMRYYLPLAAPHAILVAIVLDGCQGRSVPRPVMHALRTLLLVLAILVAVVAAYLESDGWPLLLLACALLGSIAFAHHSNRGSAAASLLVACSLLVALAHAYVLTPRRATSRALSAQAAELGRHLPPDAVVFTPASADAASQHSSLFHYLDRPVRVFSDERMPPQGSYVILPRPRPASVVEPEPTIQLLEASAAPILSVDHAGGHFTLLRTRDPRFTRRKSPRDRAPEPSSHDSGQY